MIWMPWNQSDVLVCTCPSFNYATRLMETGTYRSMHTSIGIKSENRRPSCDVSNITTCYSIERHRRAVPWKIRMSEDVVTRQSQLV
jgi:hypothetical protein